jgi:phosphohistidine phosphatase
MDLILWRHADAEEGADDQARALTAKGRKQAERMARWLDGQLPEAARMIVSPATRAQQTAEALSRKKVTDDGVNTGARAADVLKAAGWPSGEGAVIVVGHQPTLGAAAALALTGTPKSWRMKKGAVWWLRSGEAGEGAMVVAVVPPEMV